MPTVTLLEPFLDFRCNLRGCCCKNWLISFRPEDLPRVLDAFDEDERERLVRGWRFFVAEDGTLERFTFGRTGPGAADERAAGEDGSEDGEDAPEGGEDAPEGGEDAPGAGGEAFDDACQFLAADGRCGLQVEKGAEILPYLCRAFPAYAHEGVDAIVADAGDDEPAIDLHFDLVCPEALNCIIDGEGPLRLVAVEAAPGSELAVRASRVMRLPEISLGDQRLSLGQLREVRRRIFAALGDPAHPVLDRFARVHYALARVARGAPVDAFAVRDDDPVAPFDGFVDGCVAVHGADALARLFRQYRRFVFDLPLADLAWDELPAALRYDPDWRAALDPADGPRAAWLQPMLRRYLAWRFFGAFERSPAVDQLSFTYGTIAHALASAFRFAVGLARWQGRPVDRSTMKVALGASEYVYRTVRLPTTSMPWCTPEG